MKQCSFTEKPELILLKESMKRFQNGKALAVMLSDRGSLQTELQGQCCLSLWRKTWGSLALCDLGFLKDAQASKAPEGYCKQS